MAIQRHNFEGELLTVVEIRQRVPRLNVEQIRRHLAAGRNTKLKMLTYDPGKVSAEQGRKTAIRNAKIRKSNPSFGRTNLLRSA